MERRALITRLSTLIRASPNIFTLDLFGHVDLVASWNSCRSFDCRYWGDSSATLAPGDALSLHIMRAADQISGDPLGEDVLIGRSQRRPTNQNTFSSSLREKIVWTPQKFVECKNMEKATNILAIGRSVKEAASLACYEDAYLFSRMFKRYMGTSPAHYQLKVRRDGAFH